MNSLAVVTPYVPALSETFIRAHIERLPAKTVLMAGRPPAIESRPVLSMPERAAYKIRRALLREGLGRETTAAYVKAFRRHGVERPLLFGLAFACQQVAHVPGEAWDVRLDRVITEQGVLSCATG